MAQRDQITAVGRRKCAIARVQLQSGNGQITVNGRPLQVHLPRATLQYIATQPFRAVGGARFAVLAKVNGGGITGQAGAISHALARALVKSDPALRPVLRKAGLLTRDPRVKERKKYGLKRARKAPQYTKR
ncbi:MAG TPA: 30S ribosomal protein S9 [Chloroflexota bacterium]|jgi:small subunit ribosomal protein S9|nr:30S ribosomal protein S9 [Chloroflexota bacterium]